MTSLRRRSALVLALSACARTPFAAAADAWPEHTLHLVVPFPPGGSTDILARIVAQKLSPALGRTMVVDNRGGAGGIIGTDMVAKAPPDGYMLLMATSGPITIVPALQSKLSYDPVRDFAPVAIIATIPVMLVVNARTPVTSVGELIAYAKARPGKLSFASTGIGATPHLAGELFKSMAGLEITHVPYKGSAPALSDLLSGQVDMMFEQVSAALPYVQAGKLRALAIGSAHRIPALPDLPTLAESGLPGFDVVSWFGLMAPAGTPPAVVARLNAELARLMREPELVERLAALGAVATTSTPQAFAQTIATELPKWNAVIRQSGTAIN